MVRYNLREFTGRENKFEYPDSTVIDGEYTVAENGSSDLNARLQAEETQQAGLQMDGDER